jgi:integrase
MASKWAALNWPEEFRDFAVGFKTPRQDRVVRYEDRGAKPFLRIAEVVDFVFWLRGQPSGFNILAGIALQGLCSLRVRETLRLTWDKVDIEKGTVTVDGRVKNIHSVRKIPVPRFVLDTLEETPIKGQRVLELLQDQDSYGRSFRRYLGRWRPQFKIEPKGLRRTLVSEFFEHGWYGDILQMYRGHKPSVSAIDWNHYISYRPEKIQEMFREQVVSKVDALVEEAIKQRPALPLSEKVVPLRNSA